MGSEERSFNVELKETSVQIFKDFLTRVAKLEELWSVGNRLLVGFQHGLEFLRRPPINRKSELIDNIIKANETERVKSYMAAGCINNHDSIQNISKLHTCLLGIHDHLTKAKSIINELENFLVDFSVAIKTRNQSLSLLRNEDLYATNLDQQVTINQKFISLQEETPLSDLEEVEMTDCAALMGIIYSMLKQDFLMQEKIVASLNLKSLPGELESYCLMWSLRPFIDDELMQQAWRRIH